MAFLYWKSTFATLIAASLFNLTVMNINKQEVKLSDYKGKVLLFTNTASKCGLAKDNMELYNQLHNDFHKEGLEILAFPSLDFNQETPDNEKIKNFFASKNAEYKVFSPVYINGKKACDVFNFLKYHSKQFDGKKIQQNGKSVIRLSSIGWNFAKFLVDQKGRVVKYYSPFASVKQLNEDIKATLKGELQGTSLADAE